MRKLRIIGVDTESSVVECEIPDSGEKFTKEACGLFILIGAHPCTDFLPDEVARDGAGYVLTGRDVPMDTWRNGCPPAGMS